jgi:hypothetical protein
VCGNLKIKRGAKNYKYQEYIMIFNNFRVSGICLKLWPELIALVLNVYMLVYLSIVIPVAPTWRVGIATGYGLDD